MLKLLLFNSSKSFELSNQGLLPELARKVLSRRVYNIRIRASGVIKFKLIIHIPIVNTQYRNISVYERQEARIRYMQSVRNAMIYRMDTSLVLVFSSLFHARKRRTDQPILVGNGQFVAARA